MRKKLFYLIVLSCVLTFDKSHSAASGVFFGNGCDEFVDCIKMTQARVQRGEVSISALNPLLVEAAKNNHDHGACLLLSAGANPNTFSPVESVNVLGKAICHGSWIVARRLLDAGANPGISTDRILAPLTVAYDMTHHRDTHPTVKANLYAFMDYCFSKYPTLVNAPLFGEERLPLLLQATVEEVDEEVQLALRHGANLEGADEEGKTSLYFAVECENLGWVTQFLERGANPLKVVRHCTEEGDIISKSCLDYARERWVSRRSPVSQEIFYRMTGRSQEIRVSSVPLRIAASEGG